MFASYYVLVFVELMNEIDKMSPPLGVLPRSLPTPYSLIVPSIILLFSFLYCLMVVMQLTRMVPGPGQADQPCICLPTSSSSWSFWICNTALFITVLSLHHGVRQTLQELDRPPLRGSSSHMLRCFPSQVHPLAP